MLLFSRLSLLVGLPKGARRNIHSGQPTTVHAVRVNALDVAAISYPPRSLGGMAYNHRLSRDMWLVRISLDRSPSESQRGLVRHGHIGHVTGMRQDVIACFVVRYASAEKRDVIAREPSLQGLV